MPYGRRMEPSRVGRFVYLAQWWFAVLLPCFFFWGRAMFGSTVGWLTVVGSVFIIPLIVIALIPPLVTRADRRGRAARSTSRGYAISSIVGWVGGVVAGLGIRDGGDTGGSGSAFTFFGMNAYASSVIALVGVVLAGLGWIASIIWATADAAGSRGFAAEPA